MKYEINEYKTNEDNSVRFTLGMEGTKPLVVVGLNPSTADDKKSDPTMSKVLGFAERGGFDGAIMLNLYPLRATEKEALPEKHCSDLYQSNLKHIEEVLKRHQKPTVLLAFGNFVTERNYLKSALKDIIALGEKYQAQWKCIALNGTGYPKHPLYASSSSELLDLDVTKLK